jgi:hypothetical protein
MRRLFVCPKDVWLAHHRDNGFHPVTGSHYLELPDGMVLVSAAFHHEGAELKWTSHPDVAALPDPVYDGKTTLAQHRDNPERRYTHVHHEALKAMGAADGDTVMDVSRKAAVIHPLVCVRHTL